MAEIQDISESPASTRPTKLRFADQSIIVFSGIPLIAQEFVYPQRPHVFRAHKLIVTSKTGVREEMDNPLIMMGEATTQAGRRVFVGGVPINKTVDAYNKYAAAHKMPRLNVLIARGGETPKGIRVSNIDVPYYSLGGQVHIRNRFDPKGRLILTVETDSGLIGPPRHRTSRGLHHLAGRR